MYEQHFHLKLAPFNLSPDPQFLYVTPSVKEALATLAYGISSRKGFVLLTGDVGTGKTTLLNVFMQWLTKMSASTAYIFNPRLEPDEFIDFMMADFGISSASTSKSRRLLELNQWLLNRHQCGMPTVLIVDEAQQLSAETLEELRLLTNLETPTHKLLQIVLSGQNELERLLAQPSLRQLKQRITLRCKTTPLTALQVGEYIAQRVKVAGGSASQIFSAEAYGAIFRISGGIVRIVNLVCEQAMIQAFCDGEPLVLPRHVEFAANELDLMEKFELVPAVAKAGTADSRFNVAGGQYNEKGTAQ